MSLLLMLGSGLVAHRVQLAVDARRQEGAKVRAGRVMPNPAALRSVAMDEPIALADLLWTRSALTFSDLFDHPDSRGNDWLLAMLRGVTTLDPSWRTAYFYGGSMMRVLGDIEGSDEIFAAGRAALPDDPYFPFSLGMNAYLYRQDPVEASALLQAASELPKAPPWYKAAAAGFLDAHGQRRAALTYLQEQLKVETEPATRHSLEHKWAALYHDDLSEGLTERKQALEAQRGRPLTELSALGDLPADPLGGKWIVAPDGVVRSSKADAELARKAVRVERSMLIRGR